MAKDQVPAAGSDVDSRKRAIKTELAAAEASGDERAAKDARERLSKVNEELRQAERAAAAQARREAAKGDPNAQQRTPAGRSSTPPQQTTTAANGGAKQTTASK